MITDLNSTLTNHTTPLLLVNDSPALVANLWDVTDKDIDQFSELVFSKIGLNPTTLPLGTCSLLPTISEAVASSRDVCNLKYLNGAAPVVYGIPVRFTALQLV